MWNSAENMYLPLNLTVQYCIDGPMIGVNGSKHVALPKQGISIVFDGQ
jgi:hypothetical protein